MLGLLYIVLIIIRLNALTLLFSFPQDLETTENHTQHIHPTPIHPVIRIRKKRLKDGSLGKNFRFESWSVFIKQTTYDMEICSGVLVSQSWVLTTGYCLYEKPEKAFIVYNKIRDQYRFIDYIFIHHGFDIQTMVNNIALLKMEVPFFLSETTKPLCIQRPQDEILNRNGCEIGFKYGALRSVSIISDLEACKNYYRRRFNREFAENIACFNASLSCIHSIHNDKFLPGSPLTCHNKQGQRILTGILNVQWTCANLKIPLIFTKVSNYHEWITDMINNWKGFSNTLCNQVYFGANEKVLNEETLIHGVGSMEERRYNQIKNDPEYFQLIQNYRSNFPVSINDHKVNKYFRPNHLQGEIPFESEEELPFDIFQPRLRFPLESTQPQFQESTLPTTIRTTTITTTTPPPTTTITTTTTTTTPTTTSTTTTPTTTTSTATTPTTTTITTTTPTTTTKTTTNIIVPQITALQNTQKPQSNPMFPNSNNERNHFMQKQIEAEISFESEGEEKRIPFILSIPLPSSPLTEHPLETLSRLPMLPSAQPPGPTTQYLLSSQIQKPAPLPQQQSPRLIKVIFPHFVQTTINPSPPPTIKPVQISQTQLPNHVNPPSLIPISPHISQSPLLHSKKTPAIESLQIPFIFLPYSFSTSSVLTPQSSPQYLLPLPVQPQPPQKKSPTPNVRLPSQHKKKLASQSRVLPVTKLSTLSRQSHFTPFSQETATRTPSVQSRVLPLAKSSESDFPLRKLSHYLFKFKGDVALQRPPHHIYLKSNANLNLNTLKSFKIILNLRKVKN